MASAGEGSADRSSDEAAVARALSHPTRVRILMSMNAPRKRMSPNDFVHETGLPIGHASYHFRELAESGCIKLVEEVPRRSATEHYYEPVGTALAWNREWKSLGPYAKQAVCASVMREGIEAASRAVSSGSFSSRPDGHLSWDTLQVDLRGWERITAVMDRALEELLDAESESEGRISADNPAFSATFLMSAFETPPQDSEAANEQSA